MFSIALTIIYHCKKPPIVCRVIFMCCVGAFGYGSICQDIETFTTQNDTRRCLDYLGTGSTKSPLRQMVETLKLNCHVDTELFNIL